MQKTEHLELNLFEDNDQVLAESFNENTRLLDSLLYHSLDVETGTYTTSGVEAVQTTIELTFQKKPYLLMIFHNYGIEFLFRDIPHTLSAGSGNINSVRAVWGENTVQLKGSCPALTYPDVTPYYVAFVK